MARFTGGGAGPIGPMGLQGPEGPMGYPGEPGVPGLDGVNGVNGLDGLNGLDGAPGAPGAPGADGLGYDWKVTEPSDSADFDSSTMYLFSDVGFGAYAVGNYVRYYVNPDEDPLGWVEGEIEGISPTALLLSVKSWSPEAEGMEGQPGGTWTIAPYMTLIGRPGADGAGYDYVLPEGFGGPGMSEDLANNPTFSIPGPFGAYVVGNYVRYYPNPQLEPTAWVEGEITSKTGDESLTITVGNWSVLALGIGGANGSDEIRPYMTLATNPSSGPRDISWQVAGGTLGTQPTFNGDPLFTGSYVRTGSMVHFRIDVDFENITSFGTGQYYLNLPFNPKYNYMFTGGCLHDFSTGITYVITGHVFAGNPQMRLESTDNSGNSSFNIPFTATAPTTLETADNFHIYGDYIAE